MNASLDLQQNAGFLKIKCLSLRKSFSELLMKVTRCPNVDKPGEKWACLAETPLTLEMGEEVRRLEEWLF